MRGETATALTQVAITHRIATGRFPAFQRNCSIRGSDKTHALTAQSEAATVSTLLELHAVHMSLPRITLQALEAFEHVARSGSVQITAGEMGLALSSVSHQIARLEAQLGVALFDRSSRPFVLTREGKQAQNHLSKSLFHLRQVTSETMMSGLLGTRALTIGIIEDFESSVTPELSAILARQMPRAALSVRNILSHEASDLLRKGAVDVAIASDMDTARSGFTHIPLLRDPFVIATPQGHAFDVSLLMQGQTDWPFLRFNQAHMIGQQIEAHLTRNRIDLAARFTFDTAPSIMAVVASGEGWSIATPLGFMRAQRFVQKVALQPLPIAPFARTISIFSRADFDLAIQHAIAEQFSQIAKQGTRDPACAIYPWLSEQFVMI